MLTIFPKLCKDCRHFNGNMAFPRCLHGDIAGFNLVTGIYKLGDCHPERETGNKCGPDGKLFLLIVKEVAA